MCLASASPYPSSRGPGRQGCSYSGALHLDALNHARSTVCGSAADGMGAGALWCLPEPTRGLEYNNHCPTSRFLRSARAVASPRRGAMSAWIMLGSGCFFVVLGVLTLNGRGAAGYAPSSGAGWGWMAVGGGFVLDGGPKLLGFFSGPAMVLSTVALGLVVLGAALQVRGGAFAKARSAGDGD